MEDRLVLLGTKGGPSLHSPMRMPTSSLLVMAGRICVVDCGLGVTRGLVKAGVRLPEINSVYITHLHSDHILELGPLLHTSWTSGLRSPVRVFGPEGTQSLLEGFYNSLNYDIDLRIRDEARNDLRSLVQVTEYSEGRVHGGEFEVSALRVPHPPVDECYALRFDGGGWRVTFSSDTRKFEPLADFAQGSDLFVHEAMLESGIERVVARAPNARRLREHLLASHTLADEAVEIAEAANAKHLILHHLIPADGPGTSPAEWQAGISRRFGGRLSIGEDGMEFSRGEA